MDEIKSLAIKHGADMIVIDQLSLMSDKRRADIPRIAYNNISEDAPVFGEEAPVEVVEEKQEEPQEKAYTVEEVAQILGCSERNVYRNIQSGKLEAVEREVMIPTLKKFVTEEALEKYKAGRAS